MSLARLESACSRVLRLLYDVYCAVLCLSIADSFSHDRSHMELRSVQVPRNWGKITRK